MTKSNAAITWRWGLRWILTVPRIPARGLSVCSTAVETRSSSSSAKSCNTKGLVCNYSYWRSEGSLLVATFLWSNQLHCIYLELKWSLCSNQETVFPRFEKAMCSQTWDIVHMSVRPLFLNFYKWPLNNLLTNSYSWLTWQCYCIREQWPHLRRYRTNEVRHV